MDPEGSCLLTLYAYGKPRLPLVHKYSSLRSNAHGAAADLEGSVRNSCNIWPAIVLTLT